MDETLPIFHLLIYPYPILANIGSVDKALRVLGFPKHALPECLCQSRARLLGGLYAISGFYSRRPPGHQSSRMTHQTASERLEKAHCLVKNTVGLHPA